MTFLFIGHVPNTFYFTENVKFMYFRLFETLRSNSESVLSKTSFLRQMAQVT